MQQQIELVVIMIFPTLLLYLVGLNEYPKQRLIITSITMLLIVLEIMLAIW